MKCSSLNPAGDSCISGCCHIGHTSLGLPVSEHNLLYYNIQYTTTTRMRPNKTSMRFLCGSIHLFRTISCDLPKTWKDTTGDPEVSQSTCELTDSRLDLPHRGCRTCRAASHGGRPMALKHSWNLGSSRDVLASQRSFTTIWFYPSMLPLLPLPLPFPRRRRPLQQQRQQPKK